MAAPQRQPVTMAGGVATMKELTPEAYAKLDALGIVCGPASRACSPRASSRRR